MKISFKDNPTSMHLVSLALGQNPELATKFELNDNWEHDIVFTIDGMELDFNALVKDLTDAFYYSVKEEAGKLYLEKFAESSRVITDELQNIGNKLKDIRDKTLPEVNWDLADAL